VGQDGVRNRWSVQASLETGKHVSSHAYATYWQRKQLLTGPVPHFPVRRWWPTDGLCEIERVYFDAVRGVTRILDVGAGDLRIMNKFQTAGFTGEYHTQDIGNEFTYTFTDLDQASGPYGAILCLDVIEHLHLEAGLSLIARMISLLAPSGILILQTPNAHCVRSPLAWDMTHMQIYNLPDLWAYVTTFGLEATGCRIVFQSGPRLGMWSRIRGLFGQFVTTRLLGADYADNIALLARKS
jgi:hypothetical protein